MLSRYEQALEALNRRGRLRALEGRAGIDFTSNDYLGLAESAELKHAIEEALARGVPVGAGGSRLLRGNHPEHEALEIADNGAAYAYVKDHNIVVNAKGTQTTITTDGSYTIENGISVHRDEFGKIGRAHV